MSLRPRRAQPRPAWLAAVSRWGAIGAALVATAGPADAGQVVVIRSRPLAPYDAAISGFERAYRDPVTRFTVPDSGADELGDRIAALRPDAIVAVGLRAAQFARQRFPRTPLVYCVVQDPERHDLGGVWVTGGATGIPPAVELAMLRTAAPDVRRVAVFYGRATGTMFARAARQAAKELGIELIEVALNDLSELAARAREAARHADALWMPADPTIAAPEPFQFLLSLSLDTRKPLFSFSADLVRAGALAAVIPDYGAAGAQAAEAVRRIQSGERAGDIPPANVRRTRLVLNATTARALGRDVPLAARRDGEVLP